MKRLKVLACKVLSREIFTLAAKSENFIDVTTLRQGLHNTPDILRCALQEEIDKIDDGSDLLTAEVNALQDFDAILLGYGLCSNAICGISSKKYKIVVPRAHDCITLFLGSKEKYRNYFDSHSGGVYWYTAGWNENTCMPGEDRFKAILQSYKEKYGEDNAEYLMQMEQDWLREYNMCTFVNWKCLNNERHIEHAKKCAEFLNWNFDLLDGEINLMEDFLNGNWYDEGFLVVEPGQKIQQSYSENIVRAV